MRFLVSLVLVTAAGVYGFCAVEVADHWSLQSTWAFFALVLLGLAAQLWEEDA